MSDSLEEDYEKVQADFQKAFEEHHPEIQAKLEAATKLIGEAEEIAEKYGIPFRPKQYIMFCRPSYIPESMEKVWPTLESDDWSDIADAWGGGEYAGWQSSQVC